MTNVRRRRFRWSLRARLVAAVLALLATVGVVVGVATGLSLQHFLLQRLDGQVRSAVQPYAGDGDDRATGGAFGVGGLPVCTNPNSDSNGTRRAPPQEAGTLVAQATDGTVTTACTLDSAGRYPAVPAAQQAVLAALPADGRIRTVSLGSLGSYRVIAKTRVADGTTVVVGLPTSGVDDVITRLALIEVIVIGAGLVSAGLIGTVVIRRNLRPLQRVAATAAEVAEVPLDRGEVALGIRVPDEDTDPRTEAGQVGAALNRLLGHVGAALAARQASETRLRQFIADASHELRTPLAAIRGYAELTRRSREVAPPDIAHALSRVESEAERMTALVEDLLLLARLDAGRPLERVPVDLSRLVLDVVGDAHAAGPDHRWRLDLPAEPVLVTGDADRLHQVLANLLANARTHTPAGTTVTVALADAAGTVALSVVDDGPGITPAVLPTVFERFARGDASRSRAEGGTGLGLSIVDAVVTAHDGAVAVSSEPGRTAFMVRLPAAPVPVTDSTWSRQDTVSPS